MSDFRSIITPLLADLRDALAKCAEALDELERTAAVAIQPIDGVQIHACLSEIAFGFEQLADRTRQEAVVVEIETLKESAAAQQ